jgi:hypothetical protein
VVLRTKILISERDNTSSTFEFSIDRKALESALKLRNIPELAL